jgi:hypothetical protein
MAVLVELPDSSGGRNRISRFRCHSTVVLTTHISPGGWTIDPFVAAFRNAVLPSRHERQQQHKGNQTEIIFRLSEIFHPQMVSVIRSLCGRKCDGGQCILRSECWCLCVVSRKFVTSDGRWRLRLTYLIPSYRRYCIAWRDMPLGNV